MNDTTRLVLNMKGRLVHAAHLGLQFLDQDRSCPNLFLISGLLFPAKEEGQCEFLTHSICSRVRETPGQGPPSIVGAKMMQRACPIISLVSPAGVLFFFCKMSHSKAKYTAPTYLRDQQRL